MTASDDGLPPEVLQRIHDFIQHVVIPWASAEERGPMGRGSAVVGAERGGLEGVEAVAADEDGGGAGGEPGARAVPGGEGSDGGGGLEDGLGQRRGR